MSTEGALCHGGEDCPRGQGCAADGRCSAQAPADPCGGCGPGRLCVSGGLCQVRYVVALGAPPAGSPVGAGGVPVTATVGRASADLAFPPELTLTANGQDAGRLAEQPSPPGALTATYAGSYRPARDGPQGPVSLVATLTVGADTAASEPSAVVVDTVAPALSAVGVTCDATPCLRDGVLTVTATAADERPLSVAAALDLDPARPVPLSPAGGGVYTASLALRDWPFPSFQREVKVAVTAADDAGNATSLAAASPVTVTRHRWSYRDGAGAAVTSPGVLPDGALVVGVAAPQRQLRAIGPDGGERWSLTLEAAPGAGGRPVRAAPSVGASAIWAGADDGRLYASALDGASLLAACSGGADATLFTPVVRGAPEVAFAGTTAAQIIAASTGSPGLCDRPSTVNRVTTAPALSGGVLLAATADLTQNGALVRFTEAPASPGVLSRDWAAAVGLPVAAPLAVMADGRVVAASGNGHVYAVDPAAASGVAADLAQLAGAADESVVVGSGGELFLGTNDGELHRLVPGAGSSPWSDAWAGAAALAAPVRGVALVARDGSGVTLYATTGDSTSGELAAVADVAGKPVVVWRTSGLASAALQFPVVVAPPVGAPAARLPTLYAGSGDGHLHALVVDTPLDPAAPWPKSHHDLRNTGNAASPLP